MLFQSSKAWHTEILLYEVRTLNLNQGKFVGLFCVIWKYYCNISASGEHFTLYQLHNHINRTNVVKNPNQITTFVMISLMLSLLDTFCV